MSSSFERRLTGSLGQRSAEVNAVNAEADKRRRCKEANERAILAGQDRFWTRTRADLQTNIKAHPNYQKVAQFSKSPDFQAAMRTIYEMRPIKRLLKNGEYVPLPMDQVTKITDIISVAIRNIPEIIVPRFPARDLEIETLTTTEIDAAYIECNPKIALLIQESLGKLPIEVTEGRWWLNGLNGNHPQIYLDINVGGSALDKNTDPYNSEYYGEPYFFSLYLSGHIGAQYGRDFGVFYHNRNLFFTDSDDFYSEIIRRLTLAKVDGIGVTNTPNEGFGKK